MFVWFSAKLAAMRRRMALWERLRELESLRGEIVRALPGGKVEFDDLAAMVRLVYSRKRDLDELTKRVVHASYGYRWLRDELWRVRTDESRSLQTRLDEAFEGIWRPLCLELGGEPTAPACDTQASSEDCRQLLCKVCQGRAAVFRVGVAEKFGRVALHYEGVAGSTSFKTENRPFVFEWIDARRIAALHWYLYKEVVFSDGLDAYCPRCDAVFCREHMKTEVILDDDRFYDCTYGACPAGHRRTIMD